MGRRADGRDAVRRRGSREADGSAARAGPVGAAERRGGRPVTAELAARQAAWEKARADREAAEAAIPGTLVFADRDTPRDALVMARGQYDRPGDKVQPGVPAVLPPLRVARPGARPTRLD